MRDVIALAAQKLPSVAFTKVAVFALLFALTDFALRQVRLDNSKPLNPEDQLALKAASHALLALTLDKAAGAVLPSVP